MKFTKPGIFLSTAILICGCGGNIGDQLGSLQNALPVTSVLAPANGNFRLVATDAPFTYDLISSAKITIALIKVRKTDGTYTTVSELPKTIDLVTLKNGMVSSLSDITIPPGQYDLVQLHIASASIDMKDGRHFDMTVPSGAQTGLKVFVNPSINVSTQVSTDLLLDFDLSRSFLPLGNLRDPQSITGFNFMPVIRASNLTTAGTVSGKVLSDLGTQDVSDDVPLAGAIVEVKQGAVSSTAVTEVDGSFKVIGLAEGDYNLSVSAEEHNSKDSVTISIVAGNVTSAGDSLLSKIVVVEEETISQSSDE